MTFSKQSWRRNLSTVAILGMALALWAMVSQTSETTHSLVAKSETGTAPYPEVIGARLGIINYLDEGVAPLYINKGWAGGSQPLAYTSGTCCVAIPSQWKPGMTMRVEWSTDTRYEQGERKLLVRDAPVLPYAPFYDGYAWAVILPGGEVFVQPSPAGPGAKGFLQGLPEPGEATVANIQRFLQQDKSRDTLAPITRPVRP